MDDWTSTSSFKIVEYINFHRVIINIVIFSLTFIVIILVQSFTALTLGLLLGSAISNIKLAQIIGPLIIVVFLIFGGQFVNLSSVPEVFKWYDNNIRHMYF